MFLVLEFDKYGIRWKIKEFYDKDNMKKITFC